MKKRLMYSLAAVVLVVLALWLAMSVTKAAGSKPTLSINGEAVDQREIQLLLDRQKAATYDYFLKKYGAKDSKAFWTTSFDGEVPQERVKQQALQSLVQNKVEQLLAKELGLSKDISYTAFLSAWQQENKDRRKALDQHEVIYGPTQFDKGAYYDYALSNTVSEIKKRLVQQKWTISEAELLHKYEEIKSKYFALPATMKIQQIGLSMLNDKNIQDEKKQLEVEAILKGVKQQTAAGEDLALAAASLQVDERFHLVIGERLFAPQSFDRDYRMNGELLAAAEKLSLGEVSDVVMARDNYGYLIQLVQKTDNGFQDFESVKPQVKTLVVDEKYEALVKERMQQAQVDLNEGKWTSMTVR